MGFLIISPTKKLIAVIEFKSQVGSFGNNFNNRTEEALGSAVDLWTAFRENVFPNQNAPWVGYLMTVERCAKSMSVVRVAEPHFGVLDEFKNTSYLDRYSILCRKLILERYYTSTALLWTSDSDAYGDVAEDISINTFCLRSLVICRESLTNLNNMYGNRLNGKKTRRCVYITEHNKVYVRFV